jgi:hypothetical protein
MCQPEESSQLERTSSSIQAVKSRITPALMVLPALAENPSSFWCFSRNPRACS